MIPRERLQNYIGNGQKARPTFSAAEMQRRHDAIRAHMAQAGVDAALFTSYHNINYYADFLYCQFGRRYGFLIDHDHATSISAGIDSRSAKACARSKAGMKSPVCATVSPWPP